MKVKMLTLDAGPEGVRQVGSVHDVPEKEAKELIKGGYAIDATNLKPARRSAPERAAVRRGQTATETEDEPEE